MILKLFGYDIFCNNLQHKINEANLEVSEVLITYVTNREKARVMLHIVAGHSNKKEIFLTTVFKHLEGGNCKLVTFNINIWRIKKVILVL